MLKLSDAELAKLRLGVFKYLAPPELCRDETLRQHADELVEWCLRARGELEGGG